MALSGLLKAYSDEEMGLYEDMCLNCPEVAAAPVLGLSICVTKSGRRFLCMNTVDPRTGRKNAYLHYHPDGYRSGEIRELSRKHGMDLVTEFRVVGDGVLDRRIQSRTHAIEEVR